MVIKRKKAAFNLAVTFLIIMIIAVVVFSFSVYLIKRFFTQAETIRLSYDERTEQEIERLLDDGSRVAIPFDQKIIANGESETFGIGVLNILNTGPSNDFDVSIIFDRAYDRKDVEICSISDPFKPPSLCGSPNTWLQTTTSSGIAGSGVSIEKRIKNNEQEKFLLMVEPKNAPSGTYIFNLDVKYFNGTNWVQYDTLHKLYVNVP